MSNNQALSKGKRTTFRFGAILLAFVVALMLGETAGRVFNKVPLSTFIEPRIAINPIFDWAYVHPFAAYVPKPGTFQQAGKTVNSHGFISTPELKSVDKPKGAIRIAFLGGSSTAGTGRIVPDEKTWPMRTLSTLQEALAGKRIEILNASVSGYTTFESAGRLFSQVRFFDPDIVVVYHAWNDMYYFNQDGAKDKIIHWRFPGDGNWGDKKSEIPARISRRPLDSLLGWSRLYGFLRLASADAELSSQQGELGGRPKEDSMLDSDFNPEGVRIFIDNLLTIRSQCERIGAEFYVAKQATLMSEDLPERDRKLCFTWYHTFNYQAHIRAFQAVWDAIDTTFGEPEVIESEKMTGKVEFFFDHVHPSRKGCEQLAKIVGDHLLEHSNKLNHPSP